MQTEGVLTNTVLDANKTKRHLIIDKLGSNRLTHEGDKNEY